MPSRTRAIYADDDDWERIQAAASAAGLPVSRYLIESALARATDECPQCKRVAEIVGAR